jgi:hypothetical protein
MNHLGRYAANFEPNPDRRAEEGSGAYNMRTLMCIGLGWESREKDT